MPASPVTKPYNKESKSLDSIIIEDQETFHFYKVIYDSGLHWLICCYIDDNPSIEENWYHVEELYEDNRNVLDKIESMTGISFHDSIDK